MRRIIFFAVCCLVASASSTLACEPIVPFMRAAGGPGVLGGSGVALLLAVGVKSILFGLLQRRLSFVRGSGFMVLGNILTTVIGVLAATLVGSTMPIWLVTLPIVWGLCLPAAKRITQAAPGSWLAERAPGTLATLMTGALAVSCFLFAVAQGAILTNRLALYWAIKLVAVYLALLVSITLTAFWEEWVVWRLSGAEPSERSFVVPAIRSNLVVFLGVALYAAVLIIPSRLRAQDFLVRGSGGSKQIAQVAPPNFSLERTLPARVPGSTMSTAAGKAAQLGR